MSVKNVKVDRKDLAASISTAVQEGAEALAQVAGVYPASVKHSGGCYLCMVRTDGGKMLAITCEGEGKKDFEGEVLEGIKFAPLSTANAGALRRHFPWTAPVPIGRRASFGTGDRLGIATPGHLRAFGSYEIFPVLAQQSMRELGRTERTAQDVIDDAGWGAFEAGYVGSFAADADHIKQKSEVLDCYGKGFTMFTIDASDHINTDAAGYSDEEALEKFEAMSAHDEIKERYEGRTWDLDNEVTSVSISFTGAELARCALVYHDAVEHMAHLYEELKKKAGGDYNFDFEISVDETETDTTVRDHVFVATELRARGVLWQSLAPKFTGEFQKGIDYIGDKDRFEKQFAEHALIAEKLGPYKISVHSGSDKFSIFPLVGKYTDGFFHLKTAGTSWLEAVRVIAIQNPALYRRMHEFALENFETDRASYHVTTDLGAIPELGSLKDSELPGLMDKVDSRQLLHITYGSILSGKGGEGGGYLLRGEIYDTLYEHEETYYSMLERHIGRHLETLGVRHGYGDQTPVITQ